MNWFDFIKIAALFLAAVIFHEYAHGWVANRLGDPTAKRMGRLTLNPIKHIDLYGTILLPLMLFLINSPVMFGWAKPVPVNFLGLRNPKKDMALVGIAGPAINIILAVLFSQMLRLNVSNEAEMLIRVFVQINLVLAIFNMVPIPPLDGSRLVMGFLPNRYAYFYSRLEPYGIFIVFVLLYLGLLESLVWPLVKMGTYILGVS
ncbi:MAG: site-2 protease family protein [Candidatus Omnitrophota bacterium]